MIFINGNKIRKVTNNNALNVYGIDTYSEIDAETGKEITGNQKKNFYVVSKEVSDAINLVKNYILQNQLGD